MEENKNVEMEIPNDVNSEQPSIIEDGESNPEMTDGGYPEFDLSKLTDEEKERIDEINELLKSETLDPTTAMNILVNAVQVSYDKPHFNDLDKYLIVKALTTFKLIADKQEDIVIKTV
jgi:hypothetical protein